MKKRGLSAKWTKEKKDKAKKFILKKLSDGFGMQKLLELRDDLPNRSLVNKWIMKDDDGFTQEYIMAKEIMCENTLYGMRKQTKKLVKDAYDKKITMISVNATRLDIDVQKWQLSKLIPKKYGNTLQIEDNTVPQKFEGIKYIFDKPTKKQRNRVYLTG